MTRFAVFGLVLGLAAATGTLAMSQEAQEKKAEKKKPAQIEAVLESVDAKARTITVTLGNTIDEVLTEKLKERTKGKADEKAKPAGEKKTFTLADRHVEIYIKFRTSPSVANNVERELKDLEKMIGYPVGLEAATVDGKAIVTKIIAYRGTPWKLVEPKEEKKP